MSCRRDGPIDRSAPATCQAVSPDGGPWGPMRAWPGGLAIARSIGDVDCGDYVSPRPDVRTIPAPASGFVILGSDGIWDALSLASVGRAVKKSADAQDLAKRLVRKAVQAQPISR